MIPPRKPTPDLHSLSVTTSPEAAEAIAEALLRLTGQPAVVTLSRVTGLASVAAYLTDAEFWTPGRRRELKAALQAIQSCGLEVAPGRVSWRRVPPRDWSESWKRHFRPLAIGRALLVRPSWSPRRPLPGQAELVLDPGLSFGTGQHPTTAFCLREIVRLRPRREAASLLDVGTGSGILAIAAAKLGYDPVEAFDFDPDAVAVAARNAAENRVGDRIRLQRRDVARPAAKSARPFDVVCANLTADLLQSHGPSLAARVRPGGCLVLAGILAAEFGAVQARFETLGLTLARSARVGEWRSRSFRRPS